MDHLLKSIKAKHKTVATNYMDISLFAQAVVFLSPACIVNFVGQGFIGLWNLKDLYFATYIESLLNFYFTGLVIIVVFDFCIQCFHNK